VLHVLLFSVVPSLEFLALDDLSIMDQVAPASTSWGVRHLDWKSLNVINRWIHVTGVEELANILELFAEVLGDIGFVVAALVNVVESQFKYGILKILHILGGGTHEGIVANSCNGCPCNKHVEL